MARIAYTETQRGLSFNIPIRTPFQPTIQEKSNSRFFFETTLMSNHYTNYLGAKEDF